MTAATNEAPSSDLLAPLVEQLDKLVGRHLTRGLHDRIEGGTGLEELWAPFAEAGFPHALVAESDGGSGVGWADGMRLIRRLAYHTVPLPIGETMVAHLLWTKAGGALLDGALSFGPANAGDSLRIQARRDDYVLSGQARRLPWAGWAGRALLFARDDEGAGRLCIVPTAGLVSKAGRNVAHEPRDTLDLEGLSVDPRNVVPAPAALQADGLLLHGAQLRAQQLVGATERGLDQAIVYANERVQFGRPIARFQAVQHMLARAAGELAAATAAADLALSAFECDGFAMSTAVGKSRASEAGTAVAALVHQVFGAMGFTQEHPLHYVTRRLWSWRDEFGGDAYWNGRVGAAAAEAGGERLWRLVADL